MAQTQIPNVFWAEGGVPGTPAPVAGAEGETKNYVIQVSRPLTAALNVNYSIGGTATCGTDYTIAGATCTNDGNGTGVFTFPSGTAAFTDVNFPVVFLSDTQDDNGETIVITITSGSGYNLGTGTAISITILQETGPAVFTVSGFSGAPRVGDTLRIARTADDPDGNGTVIYRWLSRDPTDRTPEFRRIREPSTVSTYTLTESEVGKTLRITAHYTDGVGFGHVVVINIPTPVLPAGGAGADGRLSTAGWLAPFGRAVAEQALEGISGRMAASRNPGLSGAIAGQALAPMSAAIAKQYRDVVSIYDVTDAPAARSMTVQEALLGSRFTLTQETDVHGGAVAFWGQASQRSFDTEDHGDGTATTVLLGVDHAMGGRLMGVALARTEADGDYGAEGADGKIETSLTAAVPYAAMPVSDRLQVWGAAGYGTGEVTVKPTGNDRQRADTKWTMAAVGLRGDVTTPTEDDSMPAVTLGSEVLWTRTSSDETSGLSAASAEATRFRLAVESRWAINIDGAQVTPKLEAGVRHDGGDVERGVGYELGGGIRWFDPQAGLSLELSGHTLFKHENEHLKESGVSVSLAYDPAPATARGPSLSLRHDRGAGTGDMLDSLFTPDGASAGMSASRHSLEAAWGFPVFGGGFTAGPRAEVGISTGARDYTLGWRVASEGKAAPDLSFGLSARRHERETQAPEHAVVIDVRARW